MSRVGEGDDEEEFPNAWAFWEQRTRQVMNGRKGLKALAELREALLALPEKRLIGRALSTAGKAEPGDRPYGQTDLDHLLEHQGSGVCAVGAFAWHQRVKAGEDPVAAMEALPLNPDYEGAPHITIETGTAAGLSMTLAWVLMSQNDDAFEGLTPEERYTAFLEWIDERLAAAPAT